MNTATQLSLTPTLMQKPSSKDFFLMKTFPKKLSNIKTLGKKSTISCKHHRLQLSPQTFRRRSQSSFLQSKSFRQSWNRWTFPCSDSMGTRQPSPTSGQSFSILHGNSLFSWCLEKRATPNHPQAQPPRQNQLQVSAPNHPTTHHWERLWKSSSGKISLSLPPNQKLVPWLPIWLQGQPQHRPSPASSSKSHRKNECPWFSKCPS